MNEERNPLRGSGEVQTTSRESNHLPLWVLLLEKRRRAFVFFESLAWQGFLFLGGAFLVHGGCG
jgi:hypothetical protein